MPANACDASRNTCTLHFAFQTILQASEKNFHQKFSGEIRLAMPAVRRTYASCECSTFIIHKTVHRKPQSLSSRCNQKATCFNDNFISFLSLRSNVSTATAAVMQVRECTSELLERTITDKAIIPTSSELRLVRLVIFDISVIV